MFRGKPHVGIRGLSRQTTVGKKIQVGKEGGKVCKVKSPSWVHGQLMENQAVCIFW